MKQIMRWTVVIALLLMVAFTVGAQDSSGGTYDLWGSPDSGGQASGGTYTLIGVAEPSVQPSGGDYQLFDGFLSVIKRLYSVIELIIDINADGLISPEDVIFIVNRIGQELTGENMIADVNQDGVIDQSDAQAVIQHLGETVP